MSYRPLLTKGAMALAQAAATRKAAAQTREAAVKARAASAKARYGGRQIAEKTRAFVLTFLSDRFHVIAGASDGDTESESTPREYIWIAFNSSGDTRCEGCGKPILVGDPMYEIVVDGREVHLGAICGRRHVEHWHYGPAKHFRAS